MTKEEFLKSFNIDDTTAHHEYSYLYKSVLLAMDKFAEQEAIDFLCSITPVGGGYVDKEGNEYEAEELYKKFKESK
jgi:hypothetical protein